jgi:hypothetical protein
MKFSIISGLIGPIVILAATLLTYFVPDESGGIGFVLLLMVYPGIIFANIMGIIILKLLLKQKYNMLYSFVVFIFSIAILLVLNLIVNTGLSPA